MNFTDSRAPTGPGFWPLQHAYEAQGFDLDARMMWAAGRLVSRDIEDEGLGHWRYEQGSIGDITGGLLFKKDGEKRPIPGWRLSPWPTVISAPKNPSQDRSDPEYQATLPVRLDREEAKRSGDVLTPDSRFQEIDPVKPKEKGEDIWPLFPRGFRGLLVTATNEEAQIEMFAPTDPRLVAPQRAGDPKMGTWVVDLKDDKAVDNTRTASLQSVWRVIKHPASKTVRFPEKKSAVAWSICPSGLDGVGWGMVFDRADGADDKPVFQAPLFARVEPSVDAGLYPSAAQVPYESSPGSPNLNAP